jgi:hypothetical protein
MVKGWVNLADELRLGLRCCGADISALKRVWRSASALEGGARESEITSRFSGQARRVLYSSMTRNHDEVAA